MKAVILAGGDGKRLRPITCTMPKPMVPLLNKPTLFYTLDLLKQHEITDVVITLGYMGDVIRKAAGDGSAWGLNITYSDPVKRLGTAGSARYAVPDCDDAILVLSGDGITDIDLSAFIEAHRASKAAVTVALYRVAEPFEYGIALTDKAGYIIRFIEKPSHGEVFSDYANTGIYAIEPSAMQLIPPAMAFDFSKDLFPLLQARQQKLFGWRLDGYWCDIGDITQYLAAARDMLDGKCSFVSSAKRYGNVYIEPNAIISSSAKLFSPCYIGAEAEIGDAVCIEPYSVIGSNTKLLNDCNVKRSVLMNNVVIRQNAELRGAVICENVQMDANAIALEGSVVGASAYVGKDAIIAPEVLVWPYKSVEAQSKCNSNIIWGEQRRIRIEDAYFTGYGDVELTPESALRIAAAYSNQYKPPYSICVGSDGAACSVMLKQAAISGAVSQGGEVVATEAACKSAFSHAIKAVGASGGIYIESNVAKRCIKLHLYGGNGIEAATDVMRAVERGFLFGEQQPITKQEIGLIHSYSGANMAYEARLLSGIDANTMLEAPKRLILASANQLTNVIARVLLKLGWSVDITHNTQRLMPVRDNATISVLCDDKENIAVCIRPELNDVFIDYHSLLCIAAVACIDAIPQNKAVVPSDMAEPLLQYMRAKGLTPVLSQEKPSNRRIAASKQGVYCDFILEPEALILKLCQLFSQNRLVSLYQELPMYHNREKQIAIGRKEFGRILRELVETEGEAVSDMTDGVRLKYDTGWVTLRPHSDNASFRVLAGSMDAEYASELCNIQLEKLRRLKRNK